MSDADRQFVDTDILVYAHDKSADRKRQSAIDLLSELWKNKTGYVSMQVLHEFYAISTSKLRPTLNIDTAAQVISIYSAWKVHVPEVADTLRAIQIQQRYNIPFWDAMIVNSAEKMGCATLWSEGLMDGQVYEGVKVLNPFKTV